MTKDFRELMNVYASEVMGGGCALSADVLERLVPAMLARPFVDVLLAYDDARCIGMATIVEGFSTSALPPCSNITHGRSSRPAPAPASPIPSYGRRRPRHAAGGAAS